MKQTLGVQIWGGQRELAKVVVFAFSFGFYSTLDTISRNGIARLSDAASGSVCEALWIDPLAFLGASITSSFP